MNKRYWVALSVLFLAGGVGVMHWLRAEGRGGEAFRESAEPEASMEAPASPGVGSGSDAEAFRALTLNDSEEGQWIFLRPQAQYREPLINKLHDDSGYQITVDISGIYTEKREVGGELFTALQVGNWSEIDEIGSPAVPVKNFLLEIPEGVTPKVEVFCRNYTRLTPLSLPPVQPPPVDSGDSRPPYEKNEDVYGSDRLYPEDNLVATTVGRLRNRRILSVQVTPVQVRPANEEALVADQIEITVSYEHDADFDSPSQSSLEETLPEGGTAGTLPKYMILMDDQFVGNETLSEFVNWKRRKGYDVVSVRTSQINGNGAPLHDEICSYLRRLPAADYPEYLLILGDHTSGNGVEGFFFETKSGGYTDLLLSCRDDTDFYPDLFCGRLPARDNAELDLMLSKALAMDRSPPLDDMYQKVVVAGQIQDYEDGADNVADRLFCETADAIASYFEQDPQGNGYSCWRAIVNPHHVTAECLWDPRSILWNSTDQIGDRVFTNFMTNSDAVERISRLVNEGVCLVQHRDHGLNLGWGSPPFRTADVNALTNGVRRPLVLSINCLTGAYHNEDNFVRALLEHPNGGAYAVVGAVDVSYSWRNDWLAHGFYAAFLDDYILWQNRSEFPDWPKHLPEPSGVYGAVGSAFRLGPMLNFGKMYMGEHYGFDERTFRLFHVFGDPESFVQLKTPEMVAADFSPVIPAGNTQLAVDVGVEGCSVCLYSEGLNIHASEVSGPDGIASFDFYGGNTGTVYVTATKLGCRPFEGAFEVNGGVVGFGAESYVVDEGGASISVSVLRTGDLSDSVSVDYRTVAGSAGSGSDFLSASGTLLFPAGVSSNSFDVSILDESEDESWETFSIVLENCTGSLALGEVAETSVMIEDNDGAGELSFRVDTLNVFESQEVVDVYVDRHNGTVGQVSVTYFVSGGSAVAGEDYEAVAGTLSFADAIASASFSVPLLDDGQDEVMETVVLALGSPSSGGSLGSLTNATVLVSDDDVTSIPGFSASAGDSQIRLTWVNPVDSPEFAGIRIVRSVDGYAVDAHEGTVVYQGVGSEYMDSGLTNDVTYYYTAFAYDESGQYSAGSGASARPVAMDFEYQVIAGSVTIIGYTGPGGIVVLPDSIMGMPVVAVGDNAFRNNASIKEVVIPSSVVSIGNYAFYNCDFLAEVTLTSGLRSIGFYAFWLCDKLHHIFLPDTVVNLGVGAAGLALQSVTVDPLNPVFSSLDGILFSKDQTVLILYPSGRTDSSYSIPDGVEKLERYAFRNNYSLKELVLAESISTLSDYAVYYCRGLEALMIPAGVTSIGKACFVGCASLDSIDVAPLNANYCSVSGVLCTKDQTSLLQYPAGISDGSYTVPSGIQTIAHSAFRGCPLLTSVEIPSSVISVDDWAFAYCSRLNSLTFSGNAPSLGGTNVFRSTTAATVYYYDRQSGWTDTYGGLHTVLLKTPYSVLSTLSWADIGEPGNEPDGQGAGRVGYLYSIGKHEVSVSQFAEAVAVEPLIANGNENHWNSGLYTSGNDVPACEIRPDEAARFCNWLTSGSVSNGPYRFAADGTVSDVNRAVALSQYETVYSLPTQDEWHKAAYWTGRGYSDYANGSDVPPAYGVDANYNSWWHPWRVGSGQVEQNGTYDMMGNVLEWTEDEYLEAGKKYYRAFGGHCSSPAVRLNSYREWAMEPHEESVFCGFRVAAMFRYAPSNTVTHGVVSVPLELVEIGGYSGFYMGKYEVTIEQFRAVTEADHTISDGDEGYWNEAPAAAGSDAPATLVSWYEAARYCNWLTSGDSSIGAYQFSAEGVVTNINRYGALGLYDHVYFLPRGVDWSRMAFRAGVVYSDYANGTDIPPEVNVEANCARTPWSIYSGTVEQNGTFNMLGNMGELSVTPTLSGLAWMSEGGDYSTKAFGRVDGNRGEVGQLTESSQLGIRLVRLRRDSDDDGLPDAWELNHFGSVTDADPSSVCANGRDTLRSAYIGGFSPRDPSGRFALKRGNSPSGRNVLQWSAVSGRVYSVYWTTNLLSGFQCLESNIPWSRGGFTNLNSKACNYYKIDVQVEE